MIGAGETVVVKRPDTQVTRYGRTTSDDWAGATETSVAGCLYAPQTTSEDNDGRTAVVQRDRLFMPVGTDIAAGDRVEIRGADFDVDGEPMEWRNPHGRGAQGIEVQVRRVVG